MKKATATSNAALAEYEVNEADMSSAVAALKGAIKELKSSKSQVSCSFKAFQRLFGRL
jgi:hypothetical protein